MTQFTGQIDNVFQPREFKLNESRLKKKINTIFTADKVLQKKPQLKRFSAKKNKRENNKTGIGVLEPHIL